MSRAQEQAWESRTPRLLVCAWGLLGNGLELQAKVSGCGQGKQNEHYPTEVFSFPALGIRVSSP